MTNSTGVTPFILRVLRIGALSLALAATPLRAETTIIHAGELLAHPGEVPLLRQTIVVDNERIVDVRTGFVDPNEFPETVTVIDLRDHFVLPGLMDVHVHLQEEMSPNNDRERLAMSPQQVLMRSVMFGMRTLVAGFTTVRDLGSSPQEMYALRDAIENGWVDGPRIVAAGSVSITGGFDVRTRGLQPELMALYTSKHDCNGPFDCRRATRDVIKYGADLVKIKTTGSVMTSGPLGDSQQMETDEIRAIVRAANRMGKKVAAHAHGEDGIIAALEAGVASIEHGSYTGPKAIKLFQQSGAYLVPTLLANDTFAKAAIDAYFLSDAEKARIAEIGDARQRNFARAYKEGVNIAFGTDSGASNHGKNAQEAVLMVEAGVSTMDVIKSATVNAADLLGIANIAGTIEVGMLADIIAVSESPLENIEELLDVDFVMKGGKVFKH